MIGVVLWSDKTSSKAVVWCEDQGELAFYDASEGGGGGHGATFEAGDVVTFDVLVRDSKRRVIDPRLIGECDGASLQDSLRERGHGPAAASRMAQVIPFGRHRSSAPASRPTRAARS
ncbi:hypothetical protein [Sulfitobacter sabulilitoris]|uniref:Cold shock domain-containing protein n=1 Tax=Sulfitobacter sabulilitoris TaxID=2562655 RepID=A0A5S3PJ44_9RHOB|nr:hypothetical protein [Sulfitobacter sabulilitoris]TMM54418.1 hypothetical protein FDT80_02150 [Sulfitobacter sabulilitoris]